MRPVRRRRGGASSADTCSAGAPWSQLNVMPTPQPFWRNGKMTDASSLSRSGLTLQLLTAGHGATVLTSFLAASPAPISRSAGMEPAWTARQADCGWNSAASFAKYDHATHTWKTRQCSLLGGLAEFSETWPNWGSMHDGECSAHTMPVWITCGNVYGLWPTPTASDEKGSVSPDTARKRAAKSSRGVRLPEFLTLKGLLPGGRHNPEFSEWLMGWPLQWTATAPLATARFQEWRQQHGIC